MPIVMVTGFKYVYNNALLFCPIILLCTMIVYNVWYIRQQYAYILHKLKWDVHIYMIYIVQSTAD